MFSIKRKKHNPMLKPTRSHSWEGFATFNWCPITDENGELNVLYRAMSLHDPLLPQGQISTIGHAVSADGVHFEGRRQLITPTEEWEKYGCEDPRVTRWGDYYYIFYTALGVYPFSRDGIKVAVAKTKDFKTIEEKHLVTPFNSKAMALFPERVGGKMAVILSVDTDKPPAKLAIRQFEKEEDLLDKELWTKWYENIDEFTLDPRRTEYDHVEVGAPPIRTSKGWLLIYSHIENYFPNPDNFQRFFGIEALLLDIDNPQKIIGRTKGPFLTPDALYEQAGNVQDIVFPSGAKVVGEILQIYYGAADTTACMAEVRLDDLIKSILPETKDAYTFARRGELPLLAPIKEHSWESSAVFNPAAIDLGGKVHILYRAMGRDATSVIGYASSRDGITIDERLDEPVYVPREEFEQKKQPGNSGCEDPRLIQIDDTIYMFYTAFDAIGPARVAVTTISCDDFVAHRWNWATPNIVTPLNIDDKDTCIFPETFNGKYLLFHRIDTVVCADWRDSLDFANEKTDRCIEVLLPRHGMWDHEKVGITAPPIKTGKGWLLLYHGISEHSHTYRVGAALLDLNDPTIVLARSADPIFEPEMQYEKEGIVPNVVFPCGAIVRDRVVYIYYGGADTVVGVATMDVDIILDAL